jgi:hypothetical protein
MKADDRAASQQHASLEQNQKPRFFASCQPTARDSPRRVMHALAAHRPSHPARRPLPVRGFLSSARPQARLLPVA